MKSLRESLFDRDLVQKDLPIEQIASEIFDPKKLKITDNETRISWLNNLWEFAEHYSTRQLQNLNIDISETPIIIKLGNPNDPIENSYQIFFLFNPDKSRNYVYDFHVFEGSYKGFPWSMRANQYWNQLQGYKKTLSNLISNMEKNYLQKLSYGIIENKSLLKKITDGLKLIYSINI